ncbi:MAG: SDR family NAD(P)-dependent oxidoreductase [bacterium]|nr:SDR family NAD(P)-dependent oxidoreductase [bacterium]
MNGWSIAGKTCLVTGGTSGIGEAAASALAKAGARLVLVARSPARAEATIARIRAVAPQAQPAVLYGDLAVQADVRRVAAEFLASERPLHVLLNNAGLMMDRRQETADGIETCFAVNHLAPFLLTNLLLDRLRASAPARVVTVSSVAHRMAGRFDLGWTQPGARYRPFHAYAASKLCNLLFTQELARRLGDSGVTATCVHPGNVATRFGQNTEGFFNWGTRLVERFRRTPEQGAETLVWLCADPAAGPTGGYFADRKAKQPGRNARDAEAARRLWDESARLARL